MAHDRGGLTDVLPPAVAGAGIGLINGAGNLGGTVGPVVFGYVRDTTGSFNAALTVGGVAMIGASLLALAIRSPAPQRDARPTPAHP